jgi:hypothetical protein
MLYMYLEVKSQMKKLMQNKCSSSKEHSHESFQVNCDKQQQNPI